MSDLNAIYTEAKFWLPFLSMVGAAWKAKNTVTGWADTLLNNHLSHIEAATASTVTETKKTNVLLEDSAVKMESVRTTLDRQNEKQVQVWAGIVNTLAILEDRSKSVRSKTPRAPRKVRTVTTIVANSEVTDKTRK